MRYFAASAAGDGDCGPAGAADCDGCASRLRARALPVCASYGGADEDQHGPRATRFRTVARGSVPPHRAPCFFSTVASPVGFLVVGLLVPSVFLSCRFRFRRSPSRRLSQLSWRPAVAPVRVHRVRDASVRAQLMTASRVSCLGLNVLGSLLLPGGGGGSVFRPAATASGCPCWWRPASHRLRPARE